MLNRSRRASTPDTHRIGKAISYPGIDPRLWISLAVVEATRVEPGEGVFVDVTLLPSLKHDVARLGSGYAGNGFGSYWPLQVGDEVLVEAPSGNPNAGLVVTERLHSPADPVPQQVVDHPEDPCIVVRPGQTLRIVVANGGKVVIDSGSEEDSIELGAEGLSPQEGLVHGQGTDPFTGLAYWMLGNQSGVVRGKK